MNILTVAPGNLQFTRLASVVAFSLIPIPMPPEDQSVLKWLLMSQKAIRRQPLPAIFPPHSVKTFPLGAFVGSVIVGHAAFYVSCHCRNSCLLKSLKRFRKMKTLKSVAQTYKSATHLPEYSLRSSRVPISLL